MDADSLTEMINRTSRSSRRRHTKKYNTGTCFDTIIINTQDRPGGHPHVEVNSELAAFSDFKPTEKPSPKNFLLSHTGNGGQRPFTPYEKREFEQKHRSERVLKGPPCARAYMRRANPPNTDFRRYYDRGDIPVKVMHGIFRKIVWLKPVDDLDLFVLLPLFFDGLREEEEPYQFLAYHGTLEILQHSSEERIVPVIPQIVIPLKSIILYI